MSLSCKFLSTFQTFPGTYLLYIKKSITGVLGIIQICVKICSVIVFMSKKCVLLQKHIFYIIIKYSECIESFQISKKIYFMKEKNVAVTHRS